MYRPRNFKTQIGLVCLLVIIMWLLSACTQFEQKLGVSEHQLTCTPADSLGCAGWNTKED
jgi:hypothetical protein